jgi:hypothetical protein
MDRSFYISECPETNRQFLCEVGIDNNICEITPELLVFAHAILHQRDHGEIRDALLSASTYLASLTKDDGTDDDHPSRSVHTDVCRALDLIGWENPPRLMSDTTAPHTH